ncbi:MAG: hypothetical protein CL454_00055 [Acidimicrobiaceae bacterium]|nr:hypothetical protein [Acidimicrobiaceae bacterium]
MARGLPLAVPFGGRVLLSRGEKAPRAAGAGRRRGAGHRQGQGRGGRKGAPPDGRPRKRDAHYEQPRGEGQRGGAARGRHAAPARRERLPSAAGKESDVGETGRVALAARAGDGERLCGLCVGDDRRAEPEDAGHVAAAGAGSRRGLRARGQDGHGAAPDHLSRRAGREHGGGRAGGGRAQGQARKRCEQSRRGGGDREGPAAGDFGHAGATRRRERGGAEGGDGDGRRDQKGAVSGEGATPRIQEKARGGHAGRPRECS